MQTLGSGRYELEAEIATGAIGTVWRARDTATGERVAVKLLRPEAAEQPTLVEAFLTEARILLDLRHPCVVRARELVPVGTRYALVLDLVNGQDLRRRLRTDGPLPPAVAVDVVAQVADALAYLHGQGIVHGDVKPGNILVPVDGSPVRLTDFGVARRVTGSGQRSATHATPEYVAPEVIGGAPPAASTDVYALGIVLYELFCGRTPYRGGAASEVLYRHISCVPVAPAGFPPDVWAVVTACLAGDPDRRPAAGTVAQSLRTLQAGLGTLAPLPASGPEAVTWQPRTIQMAAPMVAAVPIPVPEQVRATKRRLPLVAALVGAAALLALLVGTGVVLLRGHGPAQPDPRSVAVVSQQPSASPKPSTPASTGPTDTASTTSATNDDPGTSTGTGTGTQADTGNDTNNPPTVPMMPGMGSQMPAVPGH